MVNVFHLLICCFSAVSLSFHPSYLSSGSGDTCNDHTSLLRVVGSGFMHLFSLFTQLDLTITFPPAMPVDSDVSEVAQPSCSEMQTGCCTVSNIICLSVNQFYPLLLRIGLSLSPPKPLWDVESSTLSFQLCWSPGSLQVKIAFCQQLEREDKINTDEQVRYF